MRTSVSYLAVVLLLGCGDDGPNPDPGPSPLDVRISATDVFAGDEVLLRGDWYRETTRTYEFSLDGAAVSPRRVNDSTVGITVPSAAIGGLALRETVDGTEIDRATLTAYGYVRQATIPGSFWGMFTPSHGGAEPYVVSGDSAGISVIFPSTDNVVTYAGMGFVDVQSIVGVGIGITPDPDRFLVPQVGSNYMSWVLAPDTSRGAGVPYTGRFLSEMSPGMFVISGTNTLQVYDTQPGTPHFELWLNASRHVLSPAGDRFALTGSEGADSLGAPVFDAQAGSTVFRVATMPAVNDAVFSAEGSRLFLSGPGKVMAVDALIGDSLDTLTLGTGVTVLALAVDPAAPVLYLLTHETVSGPQDTKVVIRVLDSATLGVRSTVESPSDAQCGYCVLGRNSLLQVNRVTSEVTAFLGFRDHAVVLHFSLPPASALGGGAHR
jgi:hypothetical protein